MAIANGLSDAIWLASYPRSGNMFLRMLLFNEWGLKSDSPIHGDVEAGFCEPGSKNIATHMLPGVAVPWFDASECDDWPAIYILRDGREALVSLWHACCKGFGGDVKPIQPHLTLADVIRGEVWFGGLLVCPWWHHVRAWQHHLQGLRDNSIIVRYETLLTDRPAAMRQIGDALGLEPTGNEFPDFEFFRKQSPERFRAGTNETWKTEMTGDDLDLFWSIHGDTMRECGYG